MGVLAVGWGGAGGVFLARAGVWRRTSPRGRAGLGWVADGEDSSAGTRDGVAALAVVAVAWGGWGPAWLGFSPAPGCGPPSFAVVAAVFEVGIGSGSSPARGFVAGWEEGVSDSG